MDGRRSSGRSERARGLLANRVASGQSGEIEGRLRRFDGVYRWFLFRATPSFDDKGNVAKWYGTNTDIDDRKKAEQALTVQNSRLQLLLKLTNQITVESGASRCTARNLSLHS